MSNYINQTPSVRFVILAAGSVIIVTAIYAAATFLVPILLSILFAVVFWGPLAKLQERGLSTGLSLGVVLLDEASSFKKKIQAVFSDNQYAYSYFAG